MSEGDTTTGTLSTQRPEKKSGLLIRFLILTLGCLIMMVSYYCGDNPAALHDPLKRHFAAEFGEKRFEKYFNLMYSVYSMPNIILPLVGGLLIDAVGYRYMNIVFGVCLLVGQSLFASGVTERDMDLLLVGRTVYGFGGECILVGLSAMLTDWFGGSTEFALIMGIKMSVARLGSVFNNIGSRAFYQDDGIGFAVWFGVILLGGAMGCLLILLVIDIWAQNKLKHNSNWNRTLRAAAADDDDLEDNVSPSSTSSTSPHDGSATEGARAGQQSDLGALELVEQDQPPASGGLRLKEIGSFKQSYWLLLITCVLLYGAIIPFNNVSSALIIEKFICHGKCAAEAQSGAEQKASFVMGIPFITTCVLSPIIGWFVDRFGGNAVLFMTSALTLTVVHAVMAAGDTFWLLIVSLVFLGLAYTIYASSLWPSVPATLKAWQVGTGYGLMTAIQNLGLTVFPLIVAEIRVEGGNYTYVEVFFSALSLLGAIVAIYTFFHDRSEGGVLNMSAKERNDWIERQNAGILRGGARSDEDDYGDSHTRRVVAEVEDDDDNMTLIRR